MQNRRDNTPKASRFANVHNNIIILPRLVNHGIHTVPQWWLGHKQLLAAK